MGAALGAWLIGQVVGTDLFAEPLPAVVAVWVGVAIAGFGLGVGFFFGTSWPRRIAAAVGAMLVVTVAGNQINTFYDQYPTVGDVLGARSGQEIPGPPMLHPVSPTAGTAPLPVGLPLA